MKRRRESPWSAFAVVLAAGLVAAVVAPLLHRAPEAAHPVAASGGRCYEFGRRAAARPEGAPYGFLRHLAKACLMAEASTGRTRGLQRRRAEALLEKLAVLDRVIIEMEAARVHAAAADPRAAPPRPVSASGVFLIARELGVLAALDAWRESVPMTLAAFP